MEHRLIGEIRGEDYESLLMRGWRRFGLDFFRPACPTCVKCRSLRLEARGFKPDKSQRRILKANAGLRVVVEKPSLTPEHIELWNAYHAFMHDLRGWKQDKMSAADYTEAFLLMDFDFAREFRYYSGKKLVGVGLVDVLPDSISSAYFFHDPAWRKQGLGVFSVFERNRLRLDFSLAPNGKGQLLSGSMHLSLIARFALLSLCSFPLSAAEGQVSPQSKNKTKISA